MAMMHPPQPPSYHHPQTFEQVRTLWIGDLYWVDEDYLTSCFSQTGELVSVKMIRNKITGQPEGYGFIEFVSHAAAERNLRAYNGTQMPGTALTFRLNWASFGLGQKVDEHSIFIGDLAPNVTDYLLQETFRVHYSSVRGARVVTDPNTGQSKCYGFVKFAEESERNRAMAEMNGLYCSTKPMRISATFPKKKVCVQQQYVTKVPVPSAVAAPVQAYVAQPGQNGMVAQAGPNQWSGYYGYGQDYDAYAYGATQDPSLYTYGGYGYPQYPQQTEGTQEITNSAADGVAEADQELYDPLATPDVDKLNATYLSVHASGILGRLLWQCTSAHTSQMGK